MPRLPIFLPLTAAELAAASANDYPDGQVVAVTDDGNALHEARGADGARTWVKLSPGGTVSVEDVDSGGSTDGQIPVSDGAGGVTWVTVQVDDLGDADTTSTPPTDGQVLTWDGTAGEWVPAAAGGGGGGSAEKQTVDTDAAGVFQVTTGTPWQVDADGLARFSTDPLFTTGTASFAVDADGLPYLQTL